MGWKQINGRLYYYRSVRQGGQVRSEYLGSVESGALFAQLDALKRGDREAKRAAERAERERDEAEDRAVEEWFDRVEAVAEAAMLAAGYTVVDPVLPLLWYDGCCSLGPRSHGEHRPLFLGGGTDRP